MTILDIIASPAFAEGAGSAQEGNVLLNLAPLILLFVVFYFLLIRPQQKKAKEHKKMVTEIKVGDEVVTQGGMLGKITGTDEVFLHIEIAPSIMITIQRNAIASLMPKGTYKSNSAKDTDSSEKPRRRNKKVEPEQNDAENTSEEAEIIEKTDSDNQST